MRIIFSKHSRLKMRQRHISENLVKRVVRNFDIELPSYNLRRELLKRIGKKYLKVVVMRESKVAVVVTCHWVEKVKRK